MKSRMLWGIGMAGLISAGVIAQTQPQDQSKTATTEERKVTVKGCLVHDASAAATSTGSFTLSQAEITKDEPVKSNAMKDMGRDTEKVGTDVAKGTADVVTFGHAGDKDKSDVSLQIAAAPGSKVDLKSQVNHQVELVGTMSASDVAAARDKDKAKTATTPLTLKATSVKSLSDKCS